MVLTILFGVYPKPVLDMSAASVAALVDNYQPRAGQLATAAALAHENQVDDAMNSVQAIALLPVLPEIVLAVGAMVL